MTRFFRTLTLLALGALVLPLDAGAQSSRNRRSSNNNDDRSRQRIDTTFAFNKSGTIDLGAVTGDIIVTGWTKNEVRVVATADENSIDMTISNGRVELSARRYRGGDSHYELMVPVGVRVSANTVSGDVRVKGTNGEVMINTANGDVEVLDATERIEVTTLNGDIHASKLRGRVRINGTSSEVTLEDVTGDVDVRSISGDLKLHRVKSSSVRATTTSGEITYEGSIDPNGRYELTAHSGDVRIEIPSNSAATLTLQTYTGSINSQFPMTLQPGQSANRRNKKMEFTIGNGSARIAVETFSGDITIERTGRSSKED
jgi:predicted membrane protein